MRMAEVMRVSWVKTDELAKCLVIQILASLLIDARSIRSSAYDDWGVSAKTMVAGAGPAVVAPDVRVVTWVWS